ncbi:protein ECERIFERUM 16 [Impatiens glandulifera]|uniref:protein ECERIFERUM 16 n=1 Tax=Impatiens glandulifera TaxID=253017 RepID=UPI001FB15ABC|nr:protein ECERIFERUM 16 [Impatiens glandulifera]
MDAKSLAKSKRAHSLHHSKKYHPKQTPVGPAASAAAKDASNQNANQVKGNVQQSRRKNGLPSNWDRYEEDEDDLDLGNSPHVNTSDVPKSKGADYTYLISEAKSQLSSEIFPSLDDDITDFYQGLGPLISVKGQGILSWIEDDNFDVDESTVNVQASFLSLDLNALSKRLEESDLCERLFIETDDFLSEELYAQVSESICSYKSEQIQHEEASEKSFTAEEENKAADAEDELDILLNSTTTPDQTNNCFKVQNQDNSTSYSKPTSVIASLDDDLDDLLMETSNSNINLQKGGTWTSHIGGGMPKSVQLDDSIDDLLNETSNLINQSWGSPNPVIYGSVSKSRLLDDDSFFDTL